MKRFLFLFAVMISFWAVAEAQTIVSTEPSNRNVVLEEYTGIHCVYCPDGHRIALGLEHDNPGRVFPINIHTGGYATPGAGEIDLRTADGDALAVPAGISGYPAGSVNRSTNPWALSRGSWAGKVNEILSQASPVNIGVSAMVDMTTRELVVKVEYYYTADEDNATNYLTVALTQSEILGTQTGGSNFNPDYVTAEGLYRHQHALRDLLSESVWGDEISTTSKGTFGEKEYKITLPESIKSIDVVLTQLEVVAFIAQNKAEIITGAGTKVDIPAEQKVFLAIENTTNVPSLLAESITPSVTVTNNSDVAVDGYDVNLTIAGEQFTKTITEALAPNTSKVITFDTYDLSAAKGKVKVLFSGFGDIVCSAREKEVYDWSFDDNSTSMEFYSLSKDAFSLAKLTFEPNSMDDYYLDDSENPTFQYVSTTQQVWGAENTNSTFAQILYGEYGFAGKAGHLIMGEANFTEESSVNMSYYYAYADGERGGTAPKIRVQYSEDEGATWNTLDEIDAEQTKSGTFESFYYPTSSEYIKHSLSLDELAGKKAVMRISLISGTNGNIIWLDQVEFSGAAGTISVASDELDFGKVTESDYLEKSITIENTAEADLKITSIVIKDDFSGVFELVDVPSDLTIAGGESTDIKVEFMPLAIETYTAKLIINSNDPSNPALEVMLKGEGTGDGVAEEFVSNSSLQLMPNPVSTTATLKFNYTGADAATVDYKLADVTGNTVADLGTATIMSGMNTLDFNVSELAAGKYFLVITSGNAVQQVPVVVEK